MLPENLPHHWRERAEQLRDWGASADAAQLWERAATELEQALVSTGSETLTLKEAARLSGLSRGYLGDLIRAGRLPNAGRKGAPRIRRADLPPATKQHARERPRKRSRSLPKDIDIVRQLR